MSEIRKDYILERYVIIASGRAMRPDILKKENDANEDNARCFFCPGNEDKTPKTIMQVPKTGDWEMRVFENKFPVVDRSSKKGNIAEKNDLHRCKDAYGCHEVLVETPRHLEQMWDYGSEKIADLLELYAERINKLSMDEGVKHVAVFKNQGKDAGASQVHSHSQIIAYNHIPEEIRAKEEAIKDYDCCAYCKIIDIEKQSGRAIYDDENVAAFAPYASRFPFEAWFFPKRHILSLAEANDLEIKSLAEALDRALKKLKLLDAPFNLYIQEGYKDMHFHIVLAPRLGKWAGFELASGTIVNTVPPENAAEFYIS